MSDAMFGGSSRQPLADGTGRRSPELKHVLDPKLLRKLERTLSAWGATLNEARETAWDTMIDWWIGTQTGRPTKTVKHIDRYLSTVAINSLRRKRLRTNREQPVGNSALHPLAPIIRSPEDTVIEAVTLSSIAAEIRRLPQTRRAVLVRYLDGF